MISQNPFMNSIVGQRLYQQYGEYLIHLLEPWLLSGYNPEITTSTDPEGIGTFLYPVDWCGGRKHHTQRLLDVSSSSAQDDVRAGTSGAGEILVEGVDENYNSISHIFSMDGQTEVSSGISTDEFRNIYFANINKVSVYRPNRDASTAILPVGTIYVGTGGVSSGVNDEPWATILPGEGASTHGMYTVPKGKRLYITNVQMSITSTTSKFAELSMKILTNMPGAGRMSDYNAFSSGFGSTTAKDLPGYTKIQQEIFRTQGSINALGETNTVNRLFETPYIINPTDTVFFVCETVSGTTPVAVLAEGFLLDTTREALSEVDREVRRLKKPLKFKKYKN